MSTELKSWVPSPIPQLELGPARWNGTTIVSDISAAGSQRLIGIGLIERLVLESIDGEKSVEQILEGLRADGLDLPEGKLHAILNKFAFFGVIKRPFTTGRGIGQVDSESARAPGVREDQVTTAKEQRGVLALWKNMTHLATPPMFTILTVCGIAALVALAVTVPRALETLKGAEILFLALGVFVAILWSMIVTITHENAHAAVFNAYSSREPYLALTRLGSSSCPIRICPVSRS